MVAQRLREPGVQLATLPSGGMRGDEKVLERAVHSGPAEGLTSLRQGELGAFLTSEPKALFCALDNQFPHTYTESRGSASGCLGSWNSGFLITWKGHQEKRSEKSEST